jgi:GNAT superfamily N-acetyltransferase
MIKHTNNFKANIEICTATAEDAALILGFITDLAIYEKAEDEVVATESDIKHSLFGNDSVANAVICTIDSEPVGFAVYFFSYSTWLGKNGLFLEDLYVSPQHRGSGAGKALLKYLAKIALSKGCGRFEWNVLDWNEPAIGFYQELGAKPQDEWVGYRLTGKALEELAKS